MKKNYIFKIVFVFLLTGLFGFQGFAQIRMVLVNPNTDTVTIKNFGVSTVDISSYQLCDFPNYEALNDGDMVVTSGSLNLAAGAEVTVDASATSISLNASGEELGLYTSGPFSDPDNMLDYVQWITTGGTRESVAADPTLMIWVAGTAISNSVLQPYQYNGDGSSSDVGVAFWGHALGVEDFANNGFSISPNPASSRLFLQIPNGLNKINIEIFDVLGKKVYDNGYLSAPIDISDWSKGVYLVKVSTSDKVHTKRFVKQ